MALVGGSFLTGCVSNPYGPPNSTLGHDYQDDKQMASAEPRPIDPIWEIMPNWIRRLHDEHSIIHNIIFGQEPPAYRRYMVERPNYIVVHEVIPSNAERFQKFNKNKKKSDSKKKKRQYDKKRGRKSTSPPKVNLQPFNMDQPRSSPPPG